MNKKISINLANQRLERAKQDLSDAEYLYKDNRFLTANNRAYYSIFHSIRAVLALEGVDFKKHKDVLAYFNKNYVNNEILCSKKFGHKIAKASRIREDSDYDDEFTVRAEDTQSQIDTAKELIAYVENYINNYFENN